MTTSKRPAFSATSNPFSDYPGPSLTLNTATKPAIALAKAHLTSTQGPSTPAPSQGLSQGPSEGPASAIQNFIKTHLGEPYSLNPPTP